MEFDDRDIECRTCHTDLNWQTMRCFGEWNEDKKVWCEDCFEDVKEFLHKKWVEEKVPKIKEEAKILLEDIEEKRKKITNLISQTKKFITSLENNRPELTQTMTKQHSLDNFKGN